MDRIKFLEDYWDTLDSFIFDQYQKYHKEKHKFYTSFYTTCKDMLANGLELSDKQMFIIEREMRKRNVKFPKESDYFNQIKISLFVHIDFQGHKFANKTTIDAFIFLLNQIPEINLLYKHSFLSNSHLREFHNSKHKEEKYNE